MSITPRSGLSRRIVAVIAIAVGAALTTSMMAVPAAAVTAAPAAFHTTAPTAGSSAADSSTADKHRPGNHFSPPVTNQPGLAGNFVPVTPKRLLDTRNGTGVYGGGSGPVGPNSVVDLDVSGITGDPSITPTAVVLNVTVTNPTASSFLSVFPDFGGQRNGDTSTMNFQAGQTLPNLVTVPVDQGMIGFYNHSGSVDVLADIFGYYTTDKSAASLTTKTPTRILDTRNNIGGRSTPLGAGQTYALQVAGTAGIPNSVSAVVLNVTVTNATASSFVTAFPDGTGGPGGASNLNFVAGQTTSNAVIVPVGSDGKLDFFNHSGSVDVLADISGYYTTNADGVISHANDFGTVDQTRILDTRSGTGTGGKVAPVGAGQSVSLSLKNLFGVPIPGNGVTAVVLNVTVTDATANSFVTAFPDGSSGPGGASSLNFTAGETAANLVVVPVGADGSVDFFNHSGSVDVIADVLGYYQSGANLGISALAFTSPTATTDSGATVNWTITDSDPNATNIIGDIQFRELGSTPGTYVGHPWNETFQLQCCQNLVTVTDGDVHSSSYSATFPIPTFADKAGTTWAVSMIAITDDDGASLLAAGTDLDGFTNKIAATDQVDTSTIGMNPPSLNPIGLENRPFVYNGTNSIVDYSWEVDDFDVGIWRTTVTLAGPGGRTVSVTSTQSNTDTRDNGTYCSGDINGVRCQAGIEIPKGEPAGTWAVSSVTDVDNAGQSTTFANLNAGPVTVTHDGTITASGFSVSPNPVNDWTSNPTVNVSMKVTGAVGGISSIFVDTASETQMTGPCLQLSTTPTSNADGTVSVPVRMLQGDTNCIFGGITIVDGAGNASVYGALYFGAPDPNLTATQVPDTTPPSITGATLNPAGTTPNGFIQGVLHAAVGIAPISDVVVHFFDSTGKQVTSQSEAASQNLTTGDVRFDLTAPSDPGTYTIGLDVTDAGRLTTSYGTPTGKPMPGGPLTLTVTSS